jgi:signal transduction histidine kinase
LLISEQRVIDPIPVDLADIALHITTELQNIVQNPNVTLNTQLQCTPVGGDPLLLERLADPGKPASNRGAGLGLSIVRSVARVNGGDVHAFPREDGGLTVRVHVPAVSEKSIEVGIGVKCIFVTIAVCFRP